MGLGNLVNMTDGGDGCLGVIVSEETRQKLAKLATGRTFSEEIRQKMSKERIGEKNGFFGKTHSDEAKEKISLGHRNRKGIKGYSWHKLHKKWIVKIVSNKKSIHIGYFDIEADAAQAYQSARLIYFV